MDYNRAYKALYLYYMEERQSLNYVSDETGLSPKQIMKLAKGGLYPTVYLHFKKDRKVGDFSRQYSHKTRKIKESTLNYLREVCIQQIIHLGADLRDIKGYLLDEDLHENDVKDILKSITKDYSKDIEHAKKSKLTKILDVLEMPTKFGIDSKNNTVELYPHPKLNQYYFPIGVEYKPCKSYKMPDDLFEYYCEQQDKVNNIKQTDGYKGVRKSSFKRTTKEDVAQWLEMISEGYTALEIARLCKVNPTTVRYHLGKDSLKIKSS